MLKQTRAVLRQRKKIEKAARARRTNELSTLKRKTEYRARLFDELRHVEILLQFPEINSVIISVNDNMLSAFTESIYSDELANYEITQLENEPNKFKIRERQINL
jgi:hypothetical protein